MKVKREYTIKLNNACRNGQFEQPISGRFRYMLSNNLKTTEEERKLILEAFPADPKFLEYDSKRRKINDEYKITDPTDIEKMETDIKDAYLNKHEVLKTEYVDALSVQDEINKELNTFLQEEIEIDLKTVKPDDVPVILNKNHWEIWDALSEIVKDN
jgi:hypothetical protein